MGVDRSLKGFAIIAIVMEIFFAIIYGFHEGYTKDVQYADFNGLIAAVYLVMLLLIGTPHSTQVLGFSQSTSSSSPSQEWY
jgi:hypothetical protein